VHFSILTLVFTVLLNFKEGPFRNGINSTGFAHNERFSIPYFFTQG
jgi:hypothetical protein